MCATGAALVFRIDLQRAIHPTLFTPRAPGETAHPSDVMDSVAKAYPGDAVSGVEAPTTARPTYLAYVVANGRFLTLLLDPVSAELLGELPEQSVVRTLQDLHFDLLSGRTGRVVNGIGAIGLAMMCLTGIVIWWPGRANWRRGFIVGFASHWRRVLWDLHGAVGIWTVLFTAMWAVTGAYFAFPAAFRQVVNQISPLTLAQTPRSSPGRSSSTPLTSRALIDEARRYAPGLHVARVVVPASADGAFLVMFSDTRPTPAASAELRSVYLDQHTGEPLATPAATRTLGDLVMAWLATLHVGGFGGAPVKLAWCILGLAPPALFVTGFTMWWMRVVRRA